MAIYGDGKHDGGTIATLPTKPKRFNTRGKLFRLRADDGDEYETGSTFSPWKEFRAEVAEFFMPMDSAADERRIKTMGFEAFRDFLRCNEMDIEHKPEEKPTTVIFRKYTPENEVLALFPYEHAGGRFCTCYQHIGQHGAADGPGVVGDTVPATPEEYADLKKELEGIGYVLDVKKRISYGKYLKANK